MTDEEIQALCASVKAEIDEIATSAGYAVNEGHPRRFANTGEVYLSITSEYGTYNHVNISRSMISRLSESPNEAAARIIDLFKNAFPEAGNIWWRAHPKISQRCESSRGFRRDGVDSSVKIGWTARMRVLMSRKPGARSEEEFVVLWRTYMGYPLVDEHAPETMDADAVTDVA